MTFTDSSRDQLSWASGLFEGEGCFSYYSRDRRFLVRLDTTDEDVIRKFHSILRLGRVYGPRTLPSGKSCWMWTTTRFEESQQVIAIFWRWLGVRRRNRASELLKKFLSNTKEHRRPFTCARTTVNDVDFMRSKVNDGNSFGSVARMMGKHPSTVSKILRGKRRRSS